jgi:hypothetical protein
MSHLLKTAVRCLVYSKKNMLLTKWGLDWSFVQDGGLGKREAHQHTTTSLTIALPSGSLDWHTASQIA